MGIRYRRSLIQGIRDGISDFPEGFYDSFKYTTTGRNDCHPWTIGLLCRVLWSLPRVTQVAVDVRFNIARKIKFQPDLVAYRGDTPVLVVDFESPNSSDARVPRKDALAFLRWTRHTGFSPDYVIITSLPDRETPSWQLRHVGAGQANHNFRGRCAEICTNPFAFWYAVYRKRLKGQHLQGVRFVNLDRTRAKWVDLFH